MSNLLSQASLVMIPSGYKEDVVYSQIPTNGNGDLSFTRASNGTRVNSAGLVEVVPWNLVSYSEEFDNAGWTKSGGSTITSNNTTAPNGTLTADRINLSASTYSGAYQFINQPIGVYANSIYAKAGTFNYLFVLINGSSVYYVWFNLATGTVGSKGANMEGTIESVGNGWYRCTASRILNNDINHYHQFGFSDAENFTPTTTGTAFIWGAQANIGSTAKPYFPTTDRLNVPRLTYQNGGGGCPSLLLEKQSTNVVTYSEQFDNAAWTKSNTTVTANTATSPDGTQNADSIILSSGTSVKQIYSASFSAISTSYAYSGFFKKNTHNIVQLLAGPTDIVNFDLTLGTFNSPSSTSGKIENFGNGWYRCTMLASGASSSISIVNILAVDSLTSVRGEATSSTGTFYAWGAQLEASSYPTSYIPTTSSSATRVADACYRNSYAAGVSTEATIFADFEYQRNDGGYSTPGLIYNGSLGNYIYLYVLGNTIRALCANGGVVQSNIVSGTVTPNTRYKVAAAYKTNDFVLYINGSLIGTDTSGTMPTFTNSGTNTYIGTDASFTEPVGKLNEAVIFPTRLTNAELASLTTI